MKSLRFIALSLIVVLALAVLLSGCGPLVI